MYWPSWKGGNWSWIVPNWSMMFLFGSDIFMSQISLSSSQFLKYWDFFRLVVVFPLRVVLSQRCWASFMMHPLILSCDHLNYDGQIIFNFYSAEDQCKNLILNSRLLSFLLNNWVGLGPRHKMFTDAPGKK